MAAPRNTEHFSATMPQAAAKLIAERGCHNVRVADIAAARGTSTGRSAPHAVTRA